LTLIAIDLIDALSVDARLRSTLVDIDFTVFAFETRCTDARVADKTINANSTILAWLLLAAIVAVHGDGDIDTDADIGFDATENDSFIVGGRWLSDGKYGGGVWNGDYLLIVVAAARIG